MLNREIGHLHQTFGQLAAARDDQRPQRAKIPPSSRAACGSSFCSLIIATLSTSERFSR
jgi:hypothetical protein